MGQHVDGMEGALFTDDARCCGGDWASYSMGCSGLLSNKSRKPLEPTDTLATYIRLHS